MTTPMMPLPDVLTALAPLCGRSHGDVHGFSGVSSDSRKIQPGELFVALRGERFDGHDFVRDVVKAGAAVAMVDDAWVAANDVGDLPLLIVADTRKGFGLLAAAWRARFAIPVIGVVGSNGKTTVKEMIAAILAAEHGAEGRLATTGNLNNDIGVPIMLLRLNAQHRAAVIEIGMNHPGETAELAAWAKPTVGLINNAQREHQEFMKTVAAVAEEHAALIAALPADGSAVLNADDEFFPAWANCAAGRKTISFGLEDKAEVSASHIENGGFRLHTPQGEADVMLAAIGMHNVRNALAAAAAALAAGCSLNAVAQGLAAFRPVKGRLQTHVGPNGSTVIDDSYNANPDSVRAAIDVLATVPGRRILVLGDMGEVGEQGGQFHDEIGGYAKSQGIDMLLALGDISVAATHNFGPGAAHFGDVGALVAALKPLLDNHTTVLVKGSRFMRMERVIEAVTTPVGSKA